MPASPPISTSEPRPASAAARASRSVGLLALAADEQRGTMLGVMIGGGSHAHLPGGGSVLAVATSQRGVDGV